MMMQDNTPPTSPDPAPSEAPAESPPMSPPIDVPSPASPGTETPTTPISPVA